LAARGGTAVREIEQRGKGRRKARFCPFISRGGRTGGGRVREVASLAVTGVEHVHHPSGAGLAPGQGSGRGETQREWQDGST
jgi:hypothetical protein